MTHVSTQYMRSHLSELIDFSQREAVEITRHGRSVSVLISKHEYDLMRQIIDNHWNNTEQSNVKTNTTSDRLFKSFKNAHKGKGKKRELIP